ncbi:MAG: ubiquinone/menaquinone biosynthesis methyltransferase, partial [Verrucomicrobiia bacterium]
MTSNPYFVPGPQRAEKVKSLFDVVAGRYDLLNDLLSLGFHRHWKKRLARMANVGPSCRALDLCCGTGDVTFALSMEGAAVVGLDFSPRMLEAARTRTESRKQQRRGASQGTVAYVQGDALRLPFCDQTFDAVTISYGLRNLASVENGLREMLRVAKPGGRVLVLDFGKPDSGLLRRCYGFFLRRVAPILGKLSKGGPEAY